MRMTSRACGSVAFGASDRIPVLQRQLIRLAAEVFERTVAHKLGIDAAVERQVDILKEKSPKVW